MIEQKYSQQFANDNTCSPETLVNEERACCSGVSSDVNIYLVENESANDSPRGNDLLNNNNQMYSSEFTNLEQLDRRVARSPEQTSDRVPLNLFDCDRILPLNPTRNYPISPPRLHASNGSFDSSRNRDSLYNVPVSSLLSNNSSLSIYSITQENQVNHLDARVPSAPPLNPEWYPSQSQTNNNQLENFSRSSPSTESQEPSQIFFRSDSITQDHINNNFTFPSVSQINLRDDSADQDPINLNDDGEPIDGTILHSNASLVSSLLSQDVTRSPRCPQRQNPPPYDFLPPPTYFEAVLNEHLDKQKTIINKKKGKACIANDSDEDNAKL